MTVCCAPACFQYPSHLYHDVITGRCLLGLVHPALDHIEAAFQQVLWAVGLGKGSKGKVPFLSNPCHLSHAARPPSLS